jgi:hypothetical protein
MTHPMLTIEGVHGRRVQGGVARLLEGVVDEGGNVTICELGRVAH